MPPEEAPAAASLADEIVAYFRESGPVSPQALTEIVVSSETPIAIHVIPASQKRDHITLFTTGMSSRPMTVPRGGAYRFAELAIRLPADWPLAGKALKDPSQRWPLDWLRKTATYPHEEGTWLGGPIAIISNGEPPEPFAPGCPFAAMLLVADYEGIGPIHASNGRGVHVYTLMPLYPEERELERVADLGELFRRFDRLGISAVVNMRRPNVSTSDLPS
jgi:hypothetical protein